MKCIKGYEIKPCRSALGWYMGTTDDDGCPNCRISTGYAKTEEEAKNLPLDRHYAMEIQWCNEGRGCVNAFFGDDRDHLTQEEIENLQ